jgi:hypothetical protein
MPGPVRRLTSFARMDANLGKGRPVLPKTSESSFVSADMAGKAKSKNNKNVIFFILSLNA